MAKKKEQIIRLPQPIDLRYKCVRTFWGKRKIVTTSISEQRKFKKIILKFFPDNMFYDTLNEENSIDAGDQVYSCSMLDKPIDIRYRSKKSIWGKRKIVEATVSEQQKVKKVFLKLLPDNLFYDDLGQTNSVKLKRIGRDAGDIASDIFDYAIATAAFIQAFGNDDDGGDDCDCGFDDCDCDD